MNLSHCAAFVAVVDSGSFTGAARALSVSQSAVSHAVASLETELGIALLRRERRGAVPTDPGRRVLVHARAVLEHAELLRHEADAARPDSTPLIRVGTGQSFAARLLPKVITELRARSPHARIVLREGTDRQISDWLREYAIDVGVVTLPNPHLKTVPLLSDELLVVAPAGDPLVAGTSVSAHQLAEHPLIMPVGGVEPLLRTALRSAGREPTVAFRVHDLNALLAMVTEGLGATVLPTLALPPVVPGLRLLPLRPPVARHLAFGVRGAARRSPAVSTFVSVGLAVAGNWRPATAA